MKEKRTSRNNKIHCKEVGCTMRGYWIENLPDGERLIKMNAVHEGEKHVAEFKLAEMTVDLIKRDSRFAECFKKLLGGSFGV